MDLIDVSRACLRRWYIVLPILLATAAFVYHDYTSTKPVYYSNAVVALAPPNSQLPFSTAGVPVPRNGLLDSGGPVLIANLAVLSWRDPSVVSQVVTAGGRPNYNVRMFPSPGTAAPLPIIMVEATESDAGTAAATVKAAIAQAEQVLHTIQQQAGVPEAQMVRALVASPPRAPVAGKPSQIRSSISMALAGLVLAVVLALVADMLILRRKPQTAIPGIPQALRRKDLIIADAGTPGFGETAEDAASSIR